MQTGAHQEDNDNAHEDALQVAQILNALQKRGGPPKECVLPCLLHCTAHASHSIHHGSNDVIEYVM